VLLILTAAALVADALPPQPQPPPRATAAAASYVKHAGQIPTERQSFYASLSAVTVPDCEVRCSADATCRGFTFPERTSDRRCWLYASVKSLQRVRGDDYYERPGAAPTPPAPPAPPPAPPPPCTGPTCFTFRPDWSSGSAASTLPTANFSVRKLEAVVWPRDNRTYAYVDIVDYASIYYPASYSTEVGVYSSPNGFTNWSYHGIAVPRGPKGGWDGGGIASPGAAVAADGSVIVGYAAEQSPAGGINRGIGVAIAKHPLGPFVKQPTPIADPKTICSGTGRCDDVIMQSRPGGEVHIYHSVKGSNVAPGDGIRHRMSTDAGKSWGNSSLVLSSRLQPGHEPAESIAGKFFPQMCGGKGGMVIITDGCKGAGCLHAYVSKTAGDMQNFVATTRPSLTPAEHPPFGSPGSLTKGDWASQAGQIGFIPGADGNVTGVTFSLWNGEHVREKREYHGRYAMSMGYTHTVYSLSVETPPPTGRGQARLKHDDGSAAGVAPPRLPQSPFPASPTPSSVTVFDMADATAEERVLVLTAAGIVAKRSPELATIDSSGSRGPDNRTSMREWHLQLLNVSLDDTARHDLSLVVRRFAADFRGYIIADSKGNTSDSMHVAVGLSGVLRAVVVTEETLVSAGIRAAGLVQLLDARTLTLEAAFERYAASYSTGLLFNQRPEGLGGTTDLAVYANAFALFDADLTTALASKLLARLDNISFVLGWANEVNFVTSASRFGHQVLCSDGNWNLPLYMSFAPAPPASPLPAAPAPTPVLQSEPKSSSSTSASKCHADPDDDRHTVAFMFTDGDSITFDVEEFASARSDWWASPKRGQVPIAWTFQPVLQELDPVFLEWVSVAQLSFE
jgi:hypothetical protein